MLPKGSKVTEARVLRDFMRNIEHAALRCGPAAGGARAAYLNAKRRLGAIERPSGKLAGPMGYLP